MQHIKQKPFDSARFKLSFLSKVSECICILSVGLSQRERELACNYLMIHYFKLSCLMKHSNQEYHSVVPWDQPNLLRYKKKPDIISNTAPSVNAPQHLSGNVVHKKVSFA